jgi:hypothetical protein
MGMVEAQPMKASAPPTGGLILSGLTAQAFFEWRTVAMAQAPASAI